MSSYSEQPQNAPVHTSVHAGLHAKDHRLPLFSFILVLAALLVTAFVAYLNFQATRLSGDQLIRSQQLQEQALARAQQQYAEFLTKQAQLARFEKSFMARQRHYTEFMSALSDTWVSVNRKDSKALDLALERLAKSYYALEPFLEDGGRHYLQKRIAGYHSLAKQLVASREERAALILQDKTTMNNMLEDFQSYLYPLLFKPFSENETTQKGSDDELNQADG